ncbi:MAG: outer membrane protein assembly factor BamC [Betaproteobacteria bacterium]|nr:outer membrane protein assembly factor BamC [Betaproteobacteria bacterium]
MNKTIHLLPALLLVTPVLLAGCTSEDLYSEEFYGKDEYRQIRRAERVDYRSDANQSAESLVRPPRVIIDSAEQLLEVQNEEDRILPQISQARIIRAGNSRWLEIDLPVIKAWPIIREFWIRQGFIIENETPELGIIETDWQLNRAQVLSTGFTAFIDQALERLHDTGERHKFRTRVERAEDPDKTLVYISFRGIIEISTSEFERLPHDPTLEAEMLRRLMIDFRLPEESLATIEDLDQQAIDLQEFELEANLLRINLPYQQSWQRVVLALDRAGFTIEQRDQENGLLTVAYSQIDNDDDEGWFESLFSAEEESSPVSIELMLEESGSDKSLLTAPEGSEGETIATLIADNF